LGGWLGLAVSVGVGVGLDVDLTSEFGLELWFSAVMKALIPVDLVISVTRFSAFVLLEKEPACTRYQVSPEIVVGTIKD
jgi:hypothetical protein